MRFLTNVNNLLLCSHSNVIKSSRHFRWCLPATVNVTGSIRLLNAVDFTKSNPKSAFTQHVQTFMSNSSNRSIEKPQPHKSPEGVSVYKGKYTSQIIRVKLFSLSTSAMGLMAQPILWHKGLEVSGTGLGVLLCSVAGIFTFVTPVLLHFVTKKYVVDIKYNEETDEYTCLTVSFFLFKNKVRFEIESKS